MSKTINSIIQTLQSKTDFPNVTNQYSDACEYCSITRNNLNLYLQYMQKIKPKYILVGEAPGYNGCRLTGVPFTSEYIIHNGTPGFDIFSGKYMTRETDKKQKEPSATIVWDVLGKCGILPLIWNAFPFHPHEPGDINSNRKTDKNEQEFGLGILRDIISLFKTETVIAVGNVSYKLMSDNSIDCLKVRHPANGGKREFEKGLLDILK